MRVQENSVCKLCSKMRLLSSSMLSTIWHFCLVKGIIESFMTWKRTSSFVCIHAYAYVPMVEKDKSIIHQHITYPSKLFKWFKSPHTSTLIYFIQMHSWRKVFQCKQKVPKRPCDNNRSKFKMMSNVQFDTLRWFSKH